MGSGQLRVARVKLIPGQSLVPGQSQVAQQRQARLQVADGMPGLTQGQVAGRYLEQAQGVGALRSLRPESFRRLPMGLDGRLVLPQAFVAIAERVQEVGRRKQLPSGLRGR